MLFDQQAMGCWPDPEGEGGKPQAGLQGGAGPTSAGDGCIQVET